MKIITISNLKGGCGKTFSAAYLSHAIADLGHSVACFDADAQGTLSKWARAGGWTIPVLHAPGENLEKSIPRAGGSRFDYVVVDCTPKSGPIVESAMRAAEIIVVPLEPSPAEFDEVRETYDLAGGSNAYREGRAMHVLLNRVDRRALSTAEIRGALTAAGRSVLQSEIPGLQAIKMSYRGAVLRDRGFYGYTGVALELLK